MSDQQIFHPSSENADVALIHALRDTPRASISALAATLDQPRRSVSTRLHRLISSGEVRVLGAVNPSVVDLNVVALIFVATNGSIEAAVRLAESLDEAVFIATVSGEYGLAVEVRVRTHDELYALLSRFRHITGVTRLSTSIYSRIVYGSVAHERFEPIELDAADRHLIDQLQRDGRTSLQQLSKLVNLSPSTTKVRVERLIRARVLRIVVIDARRQLGSRIAVGIGLNLGASDARFSQQLAELEYVEHVAECIGSFDMIGTISASSPAALSEHLDEIRSIPAVLNLTTWTRLRAVKEDYRYHLLSHVE